MTLPCPRCTQPLVGRRIGDIVVHECPDCNGIFLDENAIGLVVEDVGQARAQALLDALPRHPHQVLPGDRKMYVKCPTCGTVMNRKLFAAGSGVVVDVCRAHGTFFDAGELPTIIDVVMAGGLEKAPRKTAERVPIRFQEDSLAKDLPIARVVRSAEKRARDVDASSAFVSLLIELLS